MKTTLRDYTEKIYEVLIHEYLQVKNKLSVIQKIKALAEIYQFAWNFPFGRFSDARLEKELQEIFNMSGLADIEINAAKSDKILHVVSSLYGHGGHTRILLSFIENDTKHEHEILITCQSIPIPEWITEVLKNNKCRLTILPNTYNCIEKVKHLLEFIKSGYKALVLYNDPNDLVPVIASFHKDLPPVVIYNHADQVMWPGASIGDFIINFREAGEKYTYEFRGGRRSVVIPFLLENKNKSLNKTEAKKIIKSEKYKYCGVAIVSPYKLRPILGLSFYDFLYDFLVTHPEIVFYLIGPSEKDWHKYSRKNIPDNLIIKGIIEQPKEYMLAADFCFETFPLAGGLGSVDICQHGAVPFFYKNAVEIAALVTVLDYSGYLQEGEQLMQYDFSDTNSISNFFGNEVRMEIHSNAVKAFIDDNYSPDKWNGKVNELYELLRKTKHSIDLVKQSSVDRSSDAVYFNNVFARTKRDLLYSLLKTGRYKWVRARLLYQFKLSRWQEVMIAFLKLN